MELTIGAGEFFPEIEQALIGMAVGEKKKVMIPSADAFGEYDQGEGLHRQVDETGRSCRCWYAGILPTTTTKRWM